MVAYAAVSLLTQGIGIVGQSLVTAEFPPPSLFPLYMKPITYLYFALLTFMYVELELHRDRVKRQPAHIISFAKFFSFFVAVVFFFELAYNLVFWAGEIAAGAILGHLNVDLINNPFPELQHPVNVVFAAKLWTVFLIAGVYCFYYLTGIEKSKMKALVPPSPTELPTAS